MGFNMYQVKGGKPKILLNARILKDTRMEDVHSEINRLVNICGRKRLSKNLAELVQYEKCRLVIPSYFRTMEEISRSVAFETSSTERCIEMYKALIISQADEIECFVAARDEFERAIALNLLTDAKTIIENMRRDLGESLWWVKAKLILLFLVGNAEEMQAFCDEIQERTSNTSSAYYFNSLIWTTQSSAPYYNLQKIIAKAVDEFSTSKQKGNAWVLEALYFPMMFVENPSLVDMDLMQLFPVIDQYGVLTNYIYSQLCEGRQDPGHERFLRSILDDFSRVISDPQLSGFLKYIKEGDRGLECNVGTEILKAYESGRYSECIQIYVDGIRNIKNPISYLNMIAKAQLYAGIDLRLGYPLLDKTIKSLKEIYSLSSRASSACEEITDNIVRFQGTGISLELQTLLAVAIPQRYSDEKLINIISASICRGGGGLPLQISMIRNGKKLFSNDYGFSTNSVPSERVLRCGPAPDTGMENDLSSLDDSLFLKKDIIEYKCRALWFSGQIEPLIMLAADYLVENPESYLCLPMDGLVDIIGRDFICTIESIIICHFYVKFISEEKRATLNELFEELIFSNGCSKPSDMFESLGELPSSKRLLFLQHICTYENLDFLSVFQSSDELRAERIKILENLYAQKLIAREPYFNELELIIRQVVMDSATSSFSRSKIFVDHDAIKRKVIPEVRSLLEIFKASIESSEGDEDEDALIILNESSRAENIGSAMLPGRRNSLLVKILEQVRDCFLFDETFGLDSNLSAEIRHGIFSNFIRSEIDSRKLITERTSSGEYEANRYWRGVYSDILTPRFLGVLNAQLAWFSENFNLLVSNAEKWMKISTTLEDSYSAFRYITHLEEFTELRESALSAHGPEDLIDEILDWLWSHTEANLEVMKERINDGFKNSIDSLFDELADRINNVKGDAELKDLMGSIHAAKNSTREIIREISEWFSRSESKTFDAQELGQLIDISISCFEKIKGRNFNIEKEVYPQVAEFFIPGNFVNSMILAMINLLTNCTRHSGLGEDVPIYISVKPYISGFVVEISNGLSQERLLEITQDFVEQKNASFSSDDTLELLRSEGGTGLAKAFHHLKSASPGFNLKVQKQDEFFSCEVTYESVDLVG